VCNSSWNNTVPEDLFDALEEQRKEENKTGHPVHHFFEAWTTQPGYPVIQVKINGTITITQVSTAVKKLQWKSAKFRKLVQHVTYVLYSREMEVMTLLHTSRNKGKGKSEVVPVLN
jgi:aminopeptidase N